ncbi:hypothetical protein V490_05141, partial [Pseudogymnoascus sp. VKM F-3557]
AEELQFEVDSDFGGEDNVEGVVVQEGDKLVNVLADTIDKSLLINDAPAAPRVLPGMKPRDPNAQPEQKVVVAQAPAAVLEPVDTNVPRAGGSDIKGKGKEIVVPIPTVTVTAPSTAADDNDDDGW